MLKLDLSKNEEKEKKQLLFFSLGLTVVAAFFSATSARSSVFSDLLLCIAGIVLVSRLWYAKIGHDIFIILSLIGGGISYFVSFVVLVFVYLFGILVFGTLLKITGMDQLRKSWIKCRQLPSMFQPAPPSPVESFGRLS